MDFFYFELLIVIIILCIINNVISFKVMMLIVLMFVFGVFNFLEGFLFKFSGNSIVYSYVIGVKIFYFVYF